MKKIKKIIFSLIFFLTPWVAFANTPNMNLNLPTVGVTIGPTWATLINSAFTTIDLHDHSPGKGVLIPVSALNINSDLAFNNFALNSVKTLRFQNQSSPLGTGSDIRSLYVSGGDLYYNNGTGYQIKVTNGNSINYLLAGGIGGDYVASGASVIYTDSTKLYTFRQPNNTNANLQGQNATLSGTLAVTGNSTLTGNAGVTGTLNVTGNTTLTTEHMTGLGTFDTNLTVGNNIGIQNTSPNTALTIGNLSTGTGEPAQFGAIQLQGSTGTSGNGGIEFKVNSLSSGTGTRIRAESSGVTNIFSIQQRYNSSVWMDKLYTFQNSILSGGNLIIRYNPDATNDNYSPFLYFGDDSTSSNNFYFINNLNGGTRSLRLYNGGAISSPIITSTYNGHVGINTSEPVDFILEITGDFGPKNNYSYNIGSSSLRFNNIYAKELIGMGDIKNPGNSTELLSRNARNAVVLNATYDYSGNLQGNAHFNVTSSNSRIGAGTYNVPFNIGLDTSSACMVTIQGGTVNCSSCTMGASDATVETFNCSTSAHTDASFSITIIGSPTVLP